MPISFDPTEAARNARAYFHGMAAEHMRPISCKYDELEHELPREWVDWYWREGRKNGPVASGPSDGMPVDTANRHSPAVRLGESSTIPFSDRRTTSALNRA